MLDKIHNPDILNCISNLSSDEVFTPPQVVSQILDRLPESIWSDKNTKFLDPTTKSGVFLREITKRLLKGLEKDFPNIEKRLSHILKNQVYGISTSNLTSLMSRRTVYCSKYANNKYSIIKFNDEEGNIRFFKSDHLWSKDGNCKYCGVNKTIYDREKDLESYSYSFIHTDDPQNFFDMKFDVIIGNPPYQMKDGGAGASATPIYNKFVEAAIKLQPRFISMIIPSRWFAGGKGLDEFRSKMLNDRRISYLNDFINAKECFPGISLGGGVNYFLWERDYSGDCNVVNTKDGKTHKQKRKLNEFDVFIRSNIGISIIKKIKNKNFISIESFVKPRNVFGISSNVRGDSSKKNRPITLHSSKGKGYLNKFDFAKGQAFVGKYKIMMSKVTSEHAGEPDSAGKYRVLSSSSVIEPSHVCTDSYLIVGPFETKKQASDFHCYMKTKFFRYLLLQATTSINLSTEKFCFIPTQTNYTLADKDYYKKYKLSKEEIEEIENTIKDY